MQHWRIEFVCEKKSQAETALRSKAISVPEFVGAALTLINLLPDKPQVGRSNILVQGEIAHRPEAEPLLGPDRKPVTDNAGMAMLVPANGFYSLWVGYTDRPVGDCIPG